MGRILCEELRKSSIMKRDPNAFIFLELVRGREANNQDEVPQARRARKQTSRIEQKVAST